MAADVRSQTARRSTASAFRWVFYASQTGASAVTARILRMRFRDVWTMITSCKSSQTLSIEKKTLDNSNTFVQK